MIHYSMCTVRVSKRQIEMTYNVAFQGKTSLCDQQWKSYQHGLRTNIMATMQIPGTASCDLPHQT
jgi:hypothetical protein